MMRRVLVFLAFMAVSTVAAYAMDGIYGYIKGNSFRPGRFYYTVAEIDGDMIYCESSNYIPWMGGVQYRIINDSTDYWDRTILYVRDEESGEVDTFLWDPHGTPALIAGERLPQVDADSFLAEVETIKAAE